MDYKEKKNGLWQFSRIPNIEESNFNKILERFQGMGIAGLVRENIQNSIDGRLPNSDKPVIVTIKTGSVPKEVIPGIDHVIERIKCLEGRSSYTKATIHHMMNEINHEEINYISFEDSNTRGLTGAENGQSGSKNDTWGIYAYSKGVHFEESDSSIETSRGGSHGVGKIASNSASDLHLMYFANCDEFGNQHLGGTVQLIEHQYEGNCYRNTGYFADVKEYESTSKFYPFENNFHSIFEKKERGLKIIIPFLREEYDNEIEIIKSVCDGFFISILEQKLEVAINDKIITRETIVDYVHNPLYYEQDITKVKKEFTPLYVDTYLNEQPQTINVSNGVKDYSFKLFFRYDEQIPKGRMAIVRTVGMKIEDFKVKNKATKPFNALLIGGPDEDAYLKSLENESHTELTYANISDSKLKKYAKKFLNKLSEEVSMVIEEAINRNNPTDGVMNTEDILYVTEVQFKKDLSNALGTAMLNKGKPIVKTSTKVPQKRKKDGIDDNLEQEPKQKEPKEKNPKLLKPKKRKVDDNSESKPRKGLKYSAHPEMVERLILGNKELVKIDFNKSGQLTKEKVCDVSFNIIDGMGIEYPNEFDKSKSYDIIIDRHSGKVCETNNGVIKDVKIENGTVELQLQLKSNYNKALKFAYYIEV